MPVPTMPALVQEEAVVAEAPAFSFAPPKGFSIPDNVQEGSPFEAVVQVRMQDGQLVLDSINGSALGTEVAEEEIVEEPAETEDTLENAMLQEGFQ